MNQRGYSAAAKPPEKRILEFADDRRVIVLLSLDHFGNVPWFVKFRERYFHLCSDGIYHELVATLVPESALVVRKGKPSRSPKRKGPAG